MAEMASQPLVNALLDAPDADRVEPGVGAQHQQAHSCTPPIPATTRRRDRRSPSSGTASIATVSGWSEMRIAATRRAAGTQRRTAGRRRRRCSMSPAPSTATTTRRSGAARGWRLRAAVRLAVPAARRSAAADPVGAARLSPSRCCPTRPAPQDAVDRILEQWERQRPELDTEAMGILGRIYRIAAAPVLATVAPGSSR